MTQKLLVTPIVILLLILFIFIYMNNPTTLSDNNKDFWKKSNEGFSKINSLILDTKIEEEIKYIKYKNYIEGKKLETIN